MLQRDLAGALSVNTHCRLTVLTVLVDKLLVSINQVPLPLPPARSNGAPPGTSSPGTPPRLAPTGPTLRVFRKNNLTTADVAALSRMLPDFSVTTGSSAIDPRNPADILFVNRDRVTPSEVVQVAEALERLGIRIRSVQQSAPGGRREVQVGTILEPETDRSMFVDSTPLRLDSLRQLSGAAFWTAAFNGRAFCQDGIGYFKDCEISRTGRPVQPTD